MQNENLSVETITNEISTECLFDRLMVESILNAFDMLSPYSIGRTQRVTKWSCDIGKVLQIDEVALKEIEIAAMICDIGMWAVPEHIINKRGRLTLMEFRIVQQHPQLTLNTLRALPLSEAIKIYVKHHHEAYDGTGYPDNLVGNDIPMGAQLINVSCALFALTSIRPYRDPISLERAIEIVTNESGKQFNPDVIDALQSSLNDGTLTNWDSSPLHDPFASVRRDIDVNFEK